LTIQPLHHQENRDHICRPDIADLRMGRRCRSTPLSSVLCILHLLYQQRPCLAAGGAGELTELSTVDEIVCGLFWACELVNDVPCADQWMRAAADRMRRSNVVAGFCRAHYGGILTAAGRGFRRRRSSCRLLGTSTRGWRCDAPPR
jgi:hypothetical protein